MSPRRTPLLCTLSLAAITFTMVGCGIGTGAPRSGSTIQTATGTVHGGQSPIQAATVNLYHTDASATTYGAAGVLIGTATTDSAGNFTIDNSATSTNCPAGTQAYITASGGYQSGQPTLVNSQMLLVAALGDCSTVSASTTVLINEITTVAAAYALSGFSTTGTTDSLPVANIGAPAGASVSTSNITSTTPAGLVHAFTNASSLANYATGAANSTITAYSNGTTVTGIIPYVEILTLADAMQACVDSQSSSSSPSTNCSTLFGYTPSINGTSPTNTYQAFVNLAHNPYPSSGSLAGILGLAGASSAFQPTLTTAPPDWSLSIVYGKGTFPVPYAVALDANDTVYFGLNAPTTSTPALYGLSTYGVSVPTFSPESTIGSNAGVRGLAADALGYIWASNNGYVVDRYSTSTGTISQTFTSSVGSCSPLAVDRSNNLWIGHVASGTGINIEELSSSSSWGLNYTASPGANTGSYGIAVDNNQNIWSAGYWSGGTQEIMIPNLGTSSSPSYTTSGTTITPLITTVGTKPYSTVFDTSGNAWVGITGSNSEATTGIQEVTANAPTSATALTLGTLVYGSTSGTNGNLLGTKATQQMAADSAGTIFIPDNNTSSQGLHVYSTSTSNTLSPEVGLKSCYLATTSTTVCGTTSAAAIYNPRQPAIDSTGSVWVAITSGGLTQIIGLAAPSYPLLSAGKWGIAPGVSSTPVP